MDLEDKIRGIFHGTVVRPDSELADWIVNVCREHITDTVAYYGSELTYMQQRIEELELELMLSKEAFDVETRVQANINPKRRSNF